MNDLVSVIIPVKDREEELQRAVRSVLNQTHGNWELFVVDDKSTIDIRAILDSIQDHRINYILNEKPNSNANVCRNIGLDYSNGTFVAMLDSDDEWLPSHLESRIKFLSESKCDGVFGGAYVDNGETRTLRLSKPFKAGQSMGNYIINHGGPQTSSHFYSAISAKKIRWDEDLIRHQDYDFCVRFAKEFKFISCDIATTIIHWKLNVKRKEDFDSQIKFMTKHRSEFSKNHWKKYYVRHYDKMRDRADVPQSIKTHFKTEALRHTQFLSLADYDMIYKPKSMAQRILNRFKFSFRVITKTQ